ncbi:MAG: AAA family ATPase [Helicobacter sp.]|nr:AAA family ATPase [Helicobacter sp.]
MVEFSDMDKESLKNGITEFVEAAKNASSNAFNNAKNLDSENFKIRHLAFLESKNICYFCDFNDKNDSKKLNRGSGKDDEYFKYDGENHFLSFYLKDAKATKCLICCDVEFRWANAREANKKNVWVAIGFSLVNKSNKKERIFIYRNFFENDFCKICENKEILNFKDKKDSTIKYSAGEDLIQILENHLQTSEFIEYFIEALGILERFKEIDFIKGEKIPLCATPLNQILYGPPGTGKTYATINKALEILGYKNAESCEEEQTCNNVESQNKDNLDYDKNKEAIYDFGLPLTESAIAREYAKLLFDYYKKKGQIQFITFHQSFSYDEFIEGIKAEVKNGNISYQVESGIFKNMCEAAKNDAENPYILIIDEINRGNISKIFGELITLLEPSKRSGECEELSVTLPYSKKRFSVPNNLFVIGTMNTADRSIARLDIALRRRFEFIEMMPDASALESIEGVDLAKMLEAMNYRIEFLLDSEHLIGHTFFIGLQDLVGLKNVFKRQIIPLLREYFYDDYEKIKAVLNNNGIVAEVAEVAEKERLKFNLNDDFIDDKKIYKITDSSEWKHETFEEIYGVNAEKNAE